MSERLKDFLVGIGFAVDEASKRKAQQAVADHEKAVTTITDDAGRSRMDRGGPGNLHRCGEWSFCLTAARMAAAQERR